MKLLSKLMFFLLGFIMPNFLFAQEYTFQHLQVPYQSLTNGVTINDSNDPWTIASAFQIPIGFSFKFYNQKFDSLLIKDNLYFDKDDYDNYLVLPFYAFKTDKYSHDKTKGKSLSPILRKTTGSIGNRIFVLEYKNAGLYDGTINDSINVQTWLYEKDYSIEFRYGKTNITSNKVYKEISPTLQGPIIGLAKNIDSSLYIISGVPNAPIMKLYDENSNDIDLYIGTPSVNSVYRFTPKNMIKTIEIDNSDIKIYYNPNAQNVNLHFSENEVIEINLFDTMGKNINKYTIKQQDYLLNVDDLSTGVYICSGIYKGKPFYYKFLKQ